jgi:hypothetical protein
VKWVLNLSTRVKLLLGFGLMVSFLVAVSAIAYIGIGTVRDSQKKRGMPGCHRHHEA